MRLEEAFAALPLVAILRGVRSDEILEITDALFQAGFRIVEVPLNSPNALRSIENLAKVFGSKMLIGAGTVLTTVDVAAASDAGARLVVSPNADIDVIAATKNRGHTAIPGVATPSEAFAALQAGADALKLFPAELVTPPVVKAMRAVLPKDAKLLPVGGITPENMKPFLHAGANGFGLGSALFKPGMSASQVGAAAKRFAAAISG